MLGEDTENLTTSYSAIIVLCNLLRNLHYQNCL